MADWHFLAFSNTCFSFLIAPRDPEKVDTEKNGHTWQYSSRSNLQPIPRIGGEGRGGGLPVLAHIQPAAGQHPQISLCRSEKELKRQWKKGMF